VKRIGSDDEDAVLGDAVARHGRRACPSDEQLAAWLEGALPPVEAARVARHAGDCAGCAEVAGAHRRAAVHSVPTRAWRAWVIAAASLAAIVLLLVVMRRGDPIAVAQVALAGGDHARAAALLAQHLDALGTAERAAAWPRLVALFAGEPLADVAPPVVARFRAPGLVSRAVRYPTGTIRARRPAFVAAGRGPAAEIVIERDDGPGADYVEVLRVPLPADVERAAFPDDAADLAPGHYALTVRGAGIVDAIHAFVVKDSAPFLEPRLAAVDAAVRDPVLRALARARVLWEAGFEGDAVAELDRIDAPPPAVAAWRMHLERRP
jgi:hypothetical protein